MPSQSQFCVYVKVLELEPFEFTSVFFVVFFCMNGNYGFAAFSLIELFLKREEGEEVDAVHYFLLFFLFSGIHL